jgi:hypothetical protein
MTNIEKLHKAIIAWYMSDDELYLHASREEAEETIKEGGQLFFRYKGKDFVKQRLDN